MDNDKRQDASPKNAAESKKRSKAVDILKRLVKEKPLGTLGGLIVLILLFTGIFADVIAPYGMNEVNLQDSMIPPSGKYLLGTDNTGRDILSRIIYGARISVIVGLSGAALCTALATVIGVISGFFGGKVDLITQRFVDAWMCFPPLILVLTVMALFGTGILQVIIILGLLYGIGQSRVVRAAVIGIKENAYVEASKAMGASNRMIITRHILPNIAAPIIIIFTVITGATILVEAVMSFLGFGIPPPHPSWGSMLSGSAVMYMYDAPWMAIWPGLALAIVVFGVNMLGDGLRDILDPRIKGGLSRYNAGRKKSKADGKLDER